MFTLFKKQPEMDKQEINQQPTFKVRVRSGSNELEIEIPLTPRSEIGMNSEGTGLRALKIVEELVEKIKKM